MTRLRQLSGGDPARLPADALPLICAGRNEALLIPHFLDYYRALGVTHVFYVDNGSDDASRDLLAGAPDVFLFETDESYYAAARGRHWTSYLARRYTMGRWTLTLDLDELLVFPLSEGLDLRALTDLLSADGAEALFTIMIDMYPEQIGAYQAGQTFLEASPYFDRGPYWVTRNDSFPHISVYGGARHRLIFDTEKEAGPVLRQGAPVLRKLPLMRWREGLDYTASTHATTPCQLAGITGALLHFKFLKDFHAYALEEVARKSRPAGEYEAYAAVAPDTLQAQLHCDATQRYETPCDLVRLGLMAAPKAHFQAARPALRTALGRKATGALWQRYAAATEAASAQFQLQPGHVLTQSPGLWDLFTPP